LFAGRKYRYRLSQNLNTRDVRGEMARFKQIGERLRAYRLGSGLTADQLASELGVSRAAVYRIEAGEVVKIDTLERMASLLETSTASLLGAGVECYSNPISFFERMRQLEAEADQIVSHFPPVSFLLMSKNYRLHLAQMLRESMPADLPPSPKHSGEIDALLDILDERKSAWQTRRLSVVNLITLPEIERFLQLGLIGRFDLPAEEVLRRRFLARAEVEHIIQILADEPMGTQIGVVADTVPNISFQLFRNQNQTALAISPYRLGEQPNIRIGIAMVTAAEEPVRLYERLAEDLWKRARKGAHAILALEALLKRFDLETKKKLRSAS
jgi:transcriptional regulator with XRE-family HTH domain